LACYWSLRENRKRGASKVLSMIRDTLGVLAQYGLTYDENEKFLEMFSGKRYLSDPANLLAG